MSSPKKPNQDTESSNSPCASPRSSKRLLKDRSFDDDKNTEKIATEKRPKLNTNKKSPSKMSLEQKVDKLLKQNETIITSTKETNDAIKVLQDDVSIIKVSQEENSEKFKKIDTEIAALKSDIATLSDENNKLRQQTLSSEIVIFGLPAVPPNHMHEFIAALSTATTLNISNNDFIYIYSTKPRNAQKSTLHAKFYHQQQKDMLVQRLRERKKANNPLLIEEIMKLNADDPRRGTEISVRSKLTTTNRDIMKEARNHKTKIKFVWEKDGRILTRQMENSPIVEIFSMKQLLEIINPIE